MSDSDQLLKLRETLLNDLVPLIDSGNIDPVERFELYTRFAQLKGEYQYFEKAYSTVQAMESNDDKMRAYLALLGDVDFEIQQSQPMKPEQQEVPVAPENTQTGSNPGEQS